ncbi:MAG: HD-GYP domain-containing protein [Acidobacteria bacterium]|nr:HD-GYP domain-containing protein [Acidobacteriota bacterium]
MKNWNRRLEKLLKNNQELLLVLMMVLIAGMIHFFVINQRAFLNFYYLPVILGAFLFGRRHGTYSAFLSICIVVFMAVASPRSFATQGGSWDELFKWLDISTWGGFLLLTGFLIGTLYEKKDKVLGELRQTYRGILVMLSQIIDSFDNYTQSHSYRVAQYAVSIAQEMGLADEEVEDIRIAALLHDLGKIGVSAEVLHKAGRLNEAEWDEMKSHASKGAQVIEPLGGQIMKILPLIIAHHEKLDGTGYMGWQGEEIPLGSRIIAVADFYDALATDRPYRKAFPPMEVMKQIHEGAGTHFDPRVVSAFENVFHQLVIPSQTVMKVVG